ncbi:putative multidrug export ATP-binding/permease protein [Methanimicrococcus sp. At1]|uniref:Multidrug export ATP-binding/permease protein n=1 Tax=Methanimicrococcus hacksteinii TaxID=3028293 RepID=A0ABU3VQN8_9EURY|nr:ABC transporter ATP-binding protein [Methanimicrococcus sp. At1]MDV0445728.1 putative multidrug export ATP-binding/permease protein [Methanimicrococcus sp. At1]
MSHNNSSKNTAANDEFGDLFGKDDSSGLMVFRIKNYLSEKGYSDLKKAILAVVITNLCLFIPAISVSVFVFELLKPFTGSVIDPGRLWISFGIALAGIILTAVSYANEYNKCYVSAYTEVGNVRTELAERLRKLPLSFFNRKDLTDLTTTIMADCTRMESALSHLVPELFGQIISITIVMIMLIVYDWRMGIAAFITFPIALFLIYLSKNLQTKYDKRLHKSKLDAADKTQEYLEGMKVIKSFKLGGGKFEALEKSLKNLMKNSFSLEFIVGVVTVGISLFLQMGLPITVAVGVYLFLGGTLEIFPLLLFLIVASRIYGPLTTVLTLISEYFFLEPSLKRLAALRNEPLMEGSKSVPIQNYGIEFQNVMFSYNKENAIKGITMQIPEGKVTALVGPSGSGKSTISKLIARFWDTTAGTISIGGTDIKTVDPEHLMEYMSFVFQDVVLFDDTVFNNIKLGRHDAADEEVYAAAKAARCDSFVNKMPGGYQTVIGENGSRLSGGERQRISIARALLKNAPVVLLDEATASLDPENEGEVQKALSELISSKTVVVIAHRLRTVTNADKIVVLDDGRIVEEGTHDELIQKDGLYKKMYGIQQKSMDWSI